jgi:hypothetical protein
LKQLADRRLQSIITFLLPAEIEELSFKFDLKKTMRNSKLQHEEGK